MVWDKYRSHFVYNKFQQTSKVDFVVFFGKFVNKNSTRSD